MPLHAGYRSPRPCRVHALQAVSILLRSARRFSAITACIIRGSPHRSGVMLPSFIGASLSNLLTHTIMVARIVLKGWRRIEEVRRRIIPSTQGFVAMWFDPSMDAVYREGFSWSPQRSVRPCLFPLILSIPLSLILSLAWGSFISIGVPCGTPLGQQ
jgi:hypothetical protein